MWSLRAKDGRTSPAPARDDFVTIHLGFKFQQRRPNFESAVLLLGATTVLPEESMNQCSDSVKFPWSSDWYLWYLWDWWTEPTTNLMQPTDSTWRRWTCQVDTKIKGFQKELQDKKLVRSSWFSRSCSCHKIRMMDSHNTWHCPSQSFFSPSTIWSPEVGPVGAENVGPCGILSAGAPPGRGPNLWMTARHPRALLPT